MSQHIDKPVSIRKVEPESDFVFVLRFIEHDTPSQLIDPMHHNYHVVELMPQQLARELR